MKFLKLLFTSIICLLLNFVSKAQNNVLERDVYFMSSNANGISIYPFLNDQINNFPTLDSFTTKNQNVVLKYTSTANGQLDSLLYFPAPGFIGVDTVHYFIYDAANSKYDSQLIYIFVGVGFCENLKSFHNNMLTTTLQSNIISVKDRYNNFWGNYGSTNDLGYYKSSYSLSTNFLIDSLFNQHYYNNLSNVLPPDFSYTNVINIYPGAYQYSNVVTMTLNNYQITGDVFTCDDTITFPLQLGAASNTTNDDTFNVFTNAANAPLDVLNNDMPQNNPAMILTNTNPVHGTLNQTNGIYYYTPTFGFKGVDSFIYKSCYYSGSNSICDSSVVRINVSCNPSIYFHQFASACNSATYNFNSKILTSSGTYFDTLPNYYGCDSIVELSLQFGVKTFSSSSATTCNNHPYNLNGKLLSLSGTYKDTVPNTHGCDSIITLFLTVKNSSTKTLSQTLCFGQSVQFGGKTITTSGVYYDTLSNQVGCDSLMQLNLTIRPKVATQLHDTICANQTILFNNLPRTHTGIYYDTLLAYNGCDSILEFFLIVKPNPTKIINAVACIGTPYFYKNRQLTKAGIYLDTILNPLGCDTFVVLNLRIGSPSVIVFNSFACPNTNYSFHGQTINKSGTYYDTSINNIGCDSIEILNLSYLNLYGATNLKTICKDDTFLFNRHKYSVPGIYFDTLTSSHFCDSIVTTILNVHPKLYLKSDTICDNRVYVFQGQLLTSSGIYRDTFLNVLGCDSIIELNLTVFPSSTSSFSKVVCLGTPFIFNGHAITSSGTYLDTLINSIGCDSIITLSATINAPSSITITDTICSNQSYVINGHIYNYTGIFHDTIPNHVGCDSLVTLDLTVHFYNTRSVFKSICANKKYVFGGKILSVAGTYVDSLKNRYGCDSVVTLSLLVFPLNEKIITQEICKGNTYVYNGVPYTAAGLYVVDTVPSSNSLDCDSILKINLVVYTPDTTVTQNNDTLYAHSSTPNTSLQWIDCSNGNSIGFGKMFVPDSAGNYALVVIYNGCADTSRCFTVFASGINNLSMLSSKLYPNPADESFVIEMKKTTAIKLVIYDLQGKAILNQQLNDSRNNIDVSHLPNGLYQVELADEQHRKYYQKLSVLHH